MHHDRASMAGEYPFGYIVEAWSAANYKYMDLVKSFAAKRLELARRVDRGELSEEQNQRQIADFYSRLQAEERRRDGH
jgi:hypothetical protein